MIGYVSTRDTTSPPATRDFIDVCLTGLAGDGGLYVPQQYPHIARPDPDDDYVRIAGKVISALAGNCLLEDQAVWLCQDAYGDFSSDQIVPLVALGPHTWLLELHHGPSLAFKDIAMRFLARLYETILTRRNQRMTIVCATSGDTGGAAAQAFAASRSVDLVILFPDRRISDTQRLFMTTTGANNIHALAIDGDFDTCQAIVKNLFADNDFRTRTRLSGVNSINWARIAAQSVYFATAQAALGEQAKIQFVVPTGNFGDAFAGYSAYRCSLMTDPDFHLAVNANRTMEHLLADGYAPAVRATPTVSPAMDIRTPSNVERLLFEATGRNATTVQTMYAASEHGEGLRLDPSTHAALRGMGFSARSVSDPQTLTEIARTHAETGMLICPHTAVGCHVARDLTAEEDTPVVVLATAHAAKFPRTVQRATGEVPSLPERCADAITGKESLATLPADTRMVAEHILRHCQTG